LSIQIAGNGSEKGTNDERAGIPFARGLSFYTMCFFPYHSQNLKTIADKNEKAVKSSYPK
jgi:hypothetical protein